MGTTALTRQTNPSEDLPAPDEAGSKRSLVASLLTGMGALGVSLGFERGASFLSNVLAARLAGPGTFGAYSLALTTANNVASYAGAGIGSTANRFVGEYPVGSSGYRSLLRVLALVAVCSAAIAAVILWLGALPVATILLRNAKLAGPLKIAALSAAGFILLECSRGLLIGQRSFPTLLLLSIMVGSGLVLAVPSTARLGAMPMLAGQAGAVFLAVLVVGWIVYTKSGSRRFREMNAATGPSVWGIWRFGLVQLSGVMGLNAAGWWVASLVARQDASLSQMAFYAIASQLRNVATLIPSLVGQTSFAMLTEEGGMDFGGSDRVLAVSSVFASLLSTLCAGTAITIVPWILRYLYGHAYLPAELASSIAIATVLIHMGSAPAAYRLNIVSLRVTGIVNVLWAVGVSAAGTWLIPSGGAVAAVESFFAAHVISMILVLVWLKRHCALPSIIINVSVLNLAIASALLAISWLRASNGIRPAPAAAACAAVTVSAVVCLWRIGRAHGIGDLQSLLSRARSGVKPGPREISSEKPISSVGA
jgi:O-antigen/teichoic acid export membrane protein